MKVTMAPFETFYEHGERENSEAPYNSEFMQRCREKALEYDKEDAFLRGPLLRGIKKCVPMHFRSQVFDGIGSFD